MENTLEEVHEHLEHLEHIASRKFKTIVTVLVLLVTAAATVAGVLVATWSGEESQAQSVRQQLAAEAVSADLHANALNATYLEALDGQTEAGWRAAFLRLHEDDFSGQTAAVLDKQAQVADQQGKPGGSVTSEQINDAVAEQAVAEQESHVKATEATDLANKEVGALTVISILAVALFLLGLAPTIPVQVSRWMFVGLATVGLVVACVRLTVVSAEATEVPTSSCIHTYAKSLVETSTQDQISKLQGVVSACPSFADAYQQLGGLQSGLNTKQGFLDAETNYRKALDLRPAYAAILYNNLASAQLFDGHVAPAQASLDAALRLDPTNEVALSTQAEQRAFSGDAVGAGHFLDRTMALVATHGSYFRTQFFAAMRADLALTQKLGIHTAVTDKFYLRVRNAEASLDVYGKPTPGDTHGATVPSITVRKATGKIGDAGSATLGFSYQGFRTGDHLSVRWYQGNTFSLTQSQIDISVGSGLAGDGTVQPDGGYTVPTPPGVWSVEVYLNGNLLRSATFTMPGGS